MLPSTHVQNLARCLVVWRARTPETRFLLVISSCFQVLLASPECTFGRRLFYLNFFEYCELCGRPIKSFSTDPNVYHMLQLKGLGRQVTPIPR